MSLEHLRIMILDDNHHMNVILRTVLNGFGVRDIIDARDAATGFEVVREYRPDIAIVDYFLGDLDGLEFTKLIRTAADSPSPYLPIILCTAYSERSRAIAAINAGVNEFAVKPVSARALFQRIRAVIEHPRPFIRTKTFFGPDRRRRPDPSFQGPFRRSNDTDYKNGDAAAG
jgi:two-component system, chemotaxis family, chemotaxis protein CheY